MKGLGVLLLVCSGCVRAQSPPALQADGSNLTVNTANALAVFRGADLISLTNAATGESYLHPQTAVPLFGVDLVHATGETLASRGWALSTDDATGQQAASIVFTDSVRTLSMTLTVDAEEIVLRVAAKVNRKGVRAATWGIAGVDLTAGHLVLPALGGSLVDLSGFPGDTVLDYPTRWQSQMMLFEGAQGGFQVYSTDVTAVFKKLRLASGNGASTLSLSFISDATPPFAESTEVPAVEWRIGAASSGGVREPRTVNAHPPNRGQTLLTWAVTLPDVNALKLSFGAGIQDGANSTGVGFLLRINSETVWKYETSLPAWKSATIDLTPWRGGQVLLEFVTDSAGQNNYDWARWAGLTITQ